MMDCGLLGRMMNVSPNEMLLGNNAFVEFKGSLAENYVLQQLIPLLDKDAVYYFSKDNSTQEVDFLVERDGVVMPIEVKAEVNVKSKSLSGFINNDHPELGMTGIRFSLSCLIWINYG